MVVDGGEFLLRGSKVLVDGARRIDRRAILFLLYFFFIFNLDSYPNNMT